MKDLSTWRREARTIDIGGRRIAWWASDEQEDEKPWLLLIHGFPTSSWDWTGIWPALAPHFRIVALDMLGFGLSEKPRIAYSIMDQADLQEALLEHLGVSEAHILAHDYGDTVAQELLARFNERSLSFSIKSICLLNGGLFPERHRPRPIQKLGLTPFGPLLGLLMTRARLRKSFDEIYGPKTMASDAEIDGHWTLMREGGGVAVFHRLLRYIPERQKYRDRWVGALKASCAPLRLINGGADPVSGAHLYHYYKEQVPNADAVLFEKIGHYPQTEAPVAVATAFLEFHKRLGTVRA
ncbi:MAG: alpha/beta hydrolase [Parvularculaceae bacterium]